MKITKCEAMDLIDSEATVYEVAGGATIGYGCFEREGARSSQWFTEHDEAIKLFNALDPERELEPNRRWFMNEDCSYFVEVLACKDGEFEKLIEYKRAQP